jgi:hypothetical protein
MCAQEAAVALCVGRLRQRKTRFDGVTAEEWHQALVSLCLCCASLGKWEELLLVAARLESAGSRLKELPAALRGQLLLGYMLLGEWEKGGIVFDSVRKADLGEQWAVQEAHCALHANPKQGLRGLLELWAEQGHPVGPIAVRGLLASCQRGELE